MTLNPGEAPTVRDKPFAEQPMGYTEATTFCPPDSQAQAPNLLDFDPLTTQDSPPSNPLPAGPARPVCQSSYSQPVYSQGVTSESMDVGQGQQYDRPVQAVDLKPGVPPTQNPPAQVAYPHSQLGGGHQDNRYSPGPFEIGGCLDHQPSSFYVPVPEVPSYPCHFGVKEGGEWHMHMSSPPLKDILM